MDNIITRIEDDSKDVETAPMPDIIGGVLSWLAVFAGLCIFALSAYMFYRFAENDVGFWVLISSFLLCFGAGALAYGPLFIIAKLIGAGRRQPRRSQAFWVMALAFPWLVAGGVMITFSNDMRYLGGGALILSAGFILWSFHHFRHCPPLSQAKKASKMNKT